MILYILANPRLMPFSEFTPLNHGTLLYFPSYINFSGASGITGAENESFPTNQVSTTGANGTAGSSVNP